MRLIYDIRNRWLVPVLGSQQPFPEPSFQFTHRDAEPLELQLFTLSEFGVASTQQIADSFALRFAAKRNNDWSGPAVVHHTTFSWIPAESVYRGAPSFSTDELVALFVQAAGVDRVSADTAAATAHLGRLLAVTEGAEITVPAALGTAGATLFILAMDEAATIVAGAGTALNWATSITSPTVPTGAVYRLTRTLSGDSWDVVKAPEQASVSLMAEFSWADLARPNDWTSTTRFTVVVNNDVIRGDEAAPVNPGAVTDYVTRAELGASYLNTNLTQAFSEDQKARGLASLGAAGVNDVLTLNPLQTLSPTQQTETRSKIGSAAATTVDQLGVDLSALTVTVGTKAAQADVTTLESDVATLQSTTLKRSGNPALSAPEQQALRSLIGAAEATSAALTEVPRLPAIWNAVGNGTTVSLNGALNAATGTATTRVVSFFDTVGKAVTSVSGTTWTSAAHGGTTGQPVLTTGAPLPAPFIAGTIYYLRDVTTNTFALAATVGGSAITASGAATSVRVYQPGTAVQPHRRVGYVSAATAGSSCGTRHNVLQWARSATKVAGGWIFSARWCHTDAAAVANARCFVGMTSVASAGILPNANPSAQLNLIGVGADIGETDLSIIHNDASGVATKIALGANFPANSRGTDVYELILTCRLDLAVVYHLRNVTTGHTATGNLTTDLPQAEHILLAPQLWRNNGTTALAVAMDIIQWQVQIP